MHKHGSGIEENHVGIVAGTEQVMYTTHSEKPSLLPWL